tara:strand:- start:112 stop:285 length:174 start_codon:yes stop_codon:yes gene_type:complete
MATLSLKRRGVDPQLLLTLRIAYAAWVTGVLGLEFYYQYLHNPAVHIFFQSRGIFLF